MGDPARVDVDFELSDRRLSSRSSNRGERPPSRYDDRPPSSRSNRPPSGAGRPPSRRSRDGPRPSSRSKNRSKPKKKKRDKTGAEGPSLSDFESDDEYALDKIPKPRHKTHGPKASDFNWDMQSQVSTLTDRNRMLQLDCDEKEQQIQELAEAILTLQDELAVAESGPSSAGVSKDLAKKNRSLGVALQREKTKSLALQHETKKLKQVLSDEAEKNAQRTLSAKENPTQTAIAEKELKEWKDKYQQLTVRMMKLQEEGRERKSQLKRVQRALQKEIGEDIPVDKVLDNSGNWKGRAQEITLLRAKVRDLKKKLAADGSMDRGRMAQSPSSRRFEQHQQELTRIAQERNQEFDRLVLDHERTLTEVEETKKRMSSIKARNKVLENESRGLRDKLKVLINKSKNDDRLVDQLRQDLETKKKQLAVMAKSGSAKSSHSRRERDEMASAKAQLQNQLDMQERTINALKEDVRKARAQRKAQFTEERDNWDADEKNHEIHLMEVELEKRQDLIELYNVRETETGDQLKRLATANAKYETRIAALEKRLGNRVASRGPSTKKEKRAQTAERMEMQIEELRAEISNLHENYEHQMHQKDTELAMTQKSLNEVRQVQQRAVAELRNKFEEMYLSFRD